MGGRRPRERVGGLSEMLQVKVPVINTQYILGMVVMMVMTMIVIMMIMIVIM